MYEVVLVATKENIFLTSVPPLTCSDEAMIESPVGVGVVELIVM